MAVVKEVDENSLYVVGTSSGILPQRFSRNQLEPCKNNFLSIDNIPDKETSFRSAVGGDSITGTQG
jgi:hypothetical protein